MDDPVFILDADVFIEAARRYYAFDLTPVHHFWDLLLRYASIGRIRSIDRIKKELERGKDELAAWANDSFSEAFASTDEEEVSAFYAVIMNWVNDQAQFTDAAKADFARGADGWLVAYAKVKGCVVVTHERPAPDSKNKVPIPNVCKKFGVSFVDTFEMLRMLSTRL
jgi:hypothetical protein